MSAKSDVFAVVSIAPHSIRSLKNKLKYAQSTIYEASEGLVQDGLAVARREHGEVVVGVADTYPAQKLREIYLKSLIHGVNPALLMKKNTIRVWKEIKKKDIKNIMKSAHLSYHTVNNILKNLVRWKLITARLM